MFPSVWNFLEMCAGVAGCYVSGYLCKSNNNTKASIQEAGGMGEALRFPAMSAKSCRILSPAPATDPLEKNIKANIEKQTPGKAANRQTIAKRNSPGSIQNAVFHSLRNKAQPIQLLFARVFAPCQSQRDNVYHAFAEI